MLQTVFIPATERASRRLMVVLHGLGDSPRGFEWLPDALDIPSLNYLLVQAPDPYYQGFSWYDFSGEERRGVERSRRLLTALLDQQRDLGIATE